MLIDLLTPYLPIDRLHALASHTPLAQQTQGAVLFADLSGFTPLTEALTQALGTHRGAEEIAQQINAVYDALLPVVHRYGGSVLGFAGDAMTCYFDQDEGLRAVAVALAMQDTMAAFQVVTLPSGEHLPLGLKVGIAVGPVRRFLVGDPRVQVLEVLAGTTLAQMAQAEQWAARGEVLLEGTAARRLAEVLQIADWRGASTSEPDYGVIAALHEEIPPHPWPEIDPSHLSEELLRPWLLSIVHERLRAGQGEFLTELRPVVALFARFGGLDYDRDAEAGTKLDTFVRWVQEVAADYEGTLLDLTLGDKGSYLYVAFGAPTAHENDALRALRVAQTLRHPPTAMAHVQEVQIGISQGTMRVGAYGGTLRRTYGVLGDEVNLAARLMQYARPGEIIASGRIHDATGTLFRWQALEEIRVKGKREQVPVFALRGEIHASSLQLTEPSPALSMIGRTVELEVLDAKLALALAKQGQVVGITAEAGLGKSRLVAEAIRRAQAQGFTGYGGECQSYGTNSPYLVWQPIWRAFFGLEGTEAPARQAEQLAHVIGELDPTLLPRLPLLGPILGLPLPDNDLTSSFEPELRKASREALLVDLLKGRVRALGPVLLVLEDCHWLDAASHDLLEAIGRAIWREPVLLLMAYRPPELGRLAAPRVNALPYFTQLALTELDESEMAHLIAQRLTQLYPGEERHSPASLVTHLAARAQGNPFYLEELVNYLHDQGLDPYEARTVEQLELPSSLHSLILSRIDALTEPQKVTLKGASIIGRLFRFAWLLGYYPTLGEAAPVRSDLDTLARLELTPLEREEPELIYLFKHIITREVAYESLPHTTRARLHEQLAAFLEGQDQAAVAGSLDLLAYHYALSENQAKAREYLRRAGEAAQAAYANGAAQAYYERLLPLLQELGEQLEIHLRLGAVLEWVGQWEQAEDHHRTALALAPPASQAQAQSALALGRLCGLRGRYAEAQAWLLQALAEWERLGEGAGRSPTAEGYFARA